MPTIAADGLTAVIRAITKSLEPKGIEDFGILEGAFQMASLEYAGTHNGEATFEISLASAGALTFTAA